MYKKLRILAMKQERKPSCPFPFPPDIHKVLKLDINPFERILGENSRGPGCAITHHKICTSRKKDLRNSFYRSQKNEIPIYLLPFAIQSKTRRKKKTISLPPYNLHENNICQTILQQRAKHLLECLNGRKLLQEVQLVS